MAVILDEPDSHCSLAAMVDTPIGRMSAANWFETSMQVDNRRDPLAAQCFEVLVAHLRIEIVPVSIEMAHAARVANRRFGRGSGSKAKLNFGGCFAYALAHVTAEPLLLKGGDLTHTDVMPASC